MVNLKNNDQIKAVAALEQAAAEYAQASAQLDLEVNAARERLKAPIRELVALAERSGIPARQIYMAAGFQQPGPFAHFLKPAKGVSTVHTSFLAAPAQTPASASPASDQAVSQLHQSDRGVRPSTGSNPVRVFEKEENPASAARMLYFTDWEGQEGRKPFVIYVHDSKPVVRERHYDVNYHGQRDAQEVAEIEQALIDYAQDTYGKTWIWEEN